MDSNFTLALPALAVQVCETCCHFTTRLRLALVQQAQVTLWMWRHVSWIRRSNETAEGCIQVKAGICGKNEVMLVSYWKNQASLATFFKSEPHQKMMTYLSDHPTNLTLYNETYRPGRSGKYVNEPNGLAIVYRRTDHEAQAKR